jgi:hypothetical protein
VRRATFYALLVLALGCDDDDGDGGQPQPDMSVVTPDTLVPDAVVQDAALDGPAPDAAPEAPDLGPDGSLEWPESVEVLVHLDGEPSPDTVVMQGGAHATFRTGPDGRVTLPIDLDVPGQVWVVGSHPRARIRAVRVEPPVRQPLVVELLRFGPDNPEYRFQDPGTPRRRNTTAQCSHCHRTIGDDWFRSQHQSAARNPRVHDLYAGTAHIDDAGACAEAGGRWLDGRAPGGGEAARCYLGAGVLPALNSDACRGPCPEPERTGACADCHAPGINGALGGRDLLEATEHAYEAGVHCDVCHRVEGIDPEGEAGVAGWLQLHRPSEPASPSLGAGGLLPITFGPSHDSPNVRMGSVQRDHFRSGEICGGCHQLLQPVLVPGVEIDRARWPSGRLPVHTTYEEWRTGVLGEATRCPSCHMPPDPRVANGGDLQLFPLAEVGLQGGWYRPPGAVRRHVWVGPRTPAGRMLQLAAAVFVRSQVVDGRVEAEVTVRNVSGGHAIPTGEPMRAMLLTVEASCEDEALPAVGGDALPGWAGAVAVRTRGDDWSAWPEARPGDRVRVVEQTDGWHDYRGVAPFDDWPPEAKGLPVVHVVGEAVVEAVEGGVARFDQPLPEGTHAYLVRGEEMLAGAAGFAFARVMVDAGGRPMAPHFLAVDVASDNRLMAQQASTSSHVFRTRCPEPEVRATLRYRPAPLDLARERGWDVRDEVMAEVRR